MGKDADGTAGSRTWGSPAGITAIGGLVTGIAGIGALVVNRSVNNESPAAPTASPPPGAVVFDDRNLDTGWNLITTDPRCESVQRPDGVVLSAVRDETVCGPFSYGVPAASSLRNTRTEITATPLGPSTDSAGIGLACRGTGEQAYSAAVEMQLGKFVPLVQDREYRLRLDCLNVDDDVHIDFFVNGTKVIATDDTSEVLTSGAIGFFVGAHEAPANAYFSNIRVYG
jgi:hypothetical protein